MNELIQYLPENNCALVMAPPGFGKTYKTLNAIKKFKRKVIFIFPLRALCEEVFIEAKKMEINVCKIKSYQQGCDLVIATSESFNSYSSKCRLANYLIILDEFHLTYNWGESFRFELIRCWEFVATLDNPVILLSATMSKKNLVAVGEELNLNFELSYFINLGNLKLKNIPSKVIFYPSYLKRSLYSRIEFLSHGDGATLIFCKFRNEVAMWEKLLKRKGYKVISCVGGEAQEFMARLSVHKKWDFIIATSVVSHGVNLPIIKRIYFTYKVLEKDQYLQMVGRGGRDGGSFECVGMNSDLVSKKYLLYNFIHIMITSVVVYWKKIVWI